VKNRRVLVMIDQASRDAFVQLLVVKYLRWRGVDVVVANQGTLIPLCEWHRPHVVLSAWHMGGVLMDYLSGIHRQTHVVLMDQEGGKLGEVNFKRSFDREHGGKRGIGARCARVLSWGAAQAQWLAELGIVDRSRIVTTGSPRLDPYLVPAAANGRRHLGVTLRGDIVTAEPTKLMEKLYRRLSVESLGGLSVGYPTWAQQEDRLWHIFASTRYMFKIAHEVSRRTQAPIVMRPGPWEREDMYGFLPSRIPTVTVAPDQSQPTYIRNAFAVVDESTSLSLEAYVAGRPTITTQALIPRLEEHTGGEGAEGTLFNAPYTQAYWRPKSVEEAVDLILQAEKGTLAPGPAAGAIDGYLRDCHGWPRTRPSSFQTADALLEMLDVPAGSRAGEAPAEDAPEVLSSLKRRLYRHVPGAAQLPKAQLYARTVRGRERELFRRYYYFPSLYPHAAEVSHTFQALLRLTGES
jgi:surface carbohydrate biosynthesis protein